MLVCAGMTASVVSRNRGHDDSRYAAVHGGLGLVFVKFSPLLSAVTELVAGCNLLGARVARH
jgi:hypothetical protein